jgi:hypothetical protein
MLAEPSILVCNGCNGYYSLAHVLETSLIVSVCQLSHSCLSFGCLVDFADSIDNVHAVLFVAALSHYDHILPSSNASPAPITASTITMVEPIMRSAPSSVSITPSSSSVTTSSTPALTLTSPPSPSFFTPVPSATVRYEMMESLNLFEDVCRSPWFSGAHIILILTKSDLLKEKCTSVPLRHTFTDYNGADDYTSYGSSTRSIILSLSLSLSRYV